jgi:hypothetical protein
MARKARKDPCIPAAQGHGDSLVDTTKDTGVSTVKSPGEGPGHVTKELKSGTIWSVKCNEADGHHDSVLPVYGRQDLVVMLTLPTCTELSGSLSGSGILGSECGAHDGPVQEMDFTVEEQGFIKASLPLLSLALQRAVCRTSVRSLST